MDVSKTQKTCCIKRDPSLSCARTVACVAIVVLHTTFAASEYFRDTLSPAESLVSAAVQHNMMWAVPVFLMVTGALQLNYRKELTLRKLYGKYIFRTAGALVLFSFIFRVFDIIADGEPFTVINILKAVEELITGHGWGHLWYLYLLIGLYVMLPFYRIIAEHASDRELRYLVFIFIVFISVIPLIETAGIDIAFYISDSLIYPMYLFLGHMIAERGLRTDRTTGIMLTAAATVLIIALDIAGRIYGISIPSELTGYASPLIIMQSAGIFSIFTCGSYDNAGMVSIIDKIDILTFGIYLIHMVFIRTLFRYMQFNPYEMMPLITIPVIVIVVFSVSGLLTAILRRVPVFRKIL